MLMKMQCIIMEIVVCEREERERRKAREEERKKAKGSVWYASVALL